MRTSLAAFLLLLFGTAFCNAQPQAAVVQGVTDDQSEIRILDLKAADDIRGARRPQLGTKRLKVTNTALRTAVKALKQGDGVVYSANAAGELTDIAPSTPKQQASQWDRFFVMLLSSVLMLAIAGVFCWGWPLPRLLKGIDGRYSNSMTQMVIWAGALATAYLSALYFRWTIAGVLGNIGIPQNLLLISGLSGLTFVGARTITERKLDTAGRQAKPSPPDPSQPPAANANLAPAAGPQAPPANAPGALKGLPPSRFPQDLAMNDRGEFDFADFQMIVITLVAVVTYLTQIYIFLGDLDYRTIVTLPDVDSTILASLGLGQGAYLAKKATSDLQS